ncbi:MAG: YihY/virulence factor BrkB family protein [Burkholderiales bacterium]|nr:YihY/virulence factor BrkB family protein [Burkholderiales bacterium]
MKRIFFNRSFISSSNFILRICYNFYKTSGTTRAGSLAFTMILSFIPFTISVASAYSWLPFANKNINKIEKYFFVNYIPHNGIEIYNQVKTFLSQADGLSMLGFSSLALATMLMLFAIENQINALWSKPAPLNIFKSLASYIMLIVTVIILTGAISILSIYINIFLPYIPHGIYIFSKALSVFATIILFSLCYKALPAHKIKVTHAILAACVATINFTIGKKIFSIYTHFIFANYHIIYGSLAFLPIFLIWIYVSCLNLLFCAEIIHGMENKYNSRLQHFVYKKLKLV